MLTDRKAIRVAFRIGFSQYTEPVGTDPDEDIKYVYSAAALGLQVALENAFVYKSRVRAYYGAGIILEKYPYEDEFGIGTISYKDAEDPIMTGRKRAGLILAAVSEVFWEWKSFLLPKFR